MNQFGHWQWYFDIMWGSLLHVPPLRHGLLSHGKIWTAWNNNKKSSFLNYTLAGILGSLHKAKQYWWPGGRLRPTNRSHITKQRTESPKQQTSELSLFVHYSFVLVYLDLNWFSDTISIKRSFRLVTTFTHCVWIAYVWSRHYPGLAYSRVGKTLHTVFFLYFFYILIYCITFSFSFIFWCE